MLSAGLAREVGQRVAAVDQAPTNASGYNTAISWQAELAGVG